MVRRSQLVLSLLLMAAAAPSSKVNGCAVAIPQFGRQSVTFQSWLRSHQEEFTALHDRFGAGIKFDGYDLWLQEQMSRKGISLVELSAASGIAADKVRSLENGQRIPTLEENWLIAKGLGGSVLEAAFVMGSIQFWGDAPSYRRAFEVFDRVTEGRIAAGYHRLGTEREKRLDAAAKLRSMIGFDVHLPNFDFKPVEKPSARPLCLWIREKFRSGTAHTEDFYERIGLFEVDWQRVLSGELVPSPCVLKRLTVEAGEGLYVPFIILAYEREVIGAS